MKNTLQTALPVLTKTPEDKRFPIILAIVANEMTAAQQDTFLAYVPDGKDDSADSRRKESQQKHRMQKLAKGRGKIAPVHPLSGNGANLMDAILKGKK